MHVSFKQQYSGTYIEQILQDCIRLILGHTLDSACETFVDEDALPSGHSCSWSVLYANRFGGLYLTICSDHRVDCFQCRALVQRRSARNRSQWVTQPGRLFVEELCVMNSRQSLQEGGHRRRQAVVDLVHGRPELQTINIVAGSRILSCYTHSVAACLWQCVNLQHGVVRRCAFKGDVRMPSNTCISACVAQLVCQSAALLLLLRADHTDLVAKFASFLGEWVDV
jgi:hypothetical protein